MPDPDPHQAIADLEAEIEALSEAVERCRKIGMAAKAMMVLGAALLPIVMTGWFRLGPLAFVLAVTAILGGIALFGSNRRTRDEIMAAIRALEARRAEMIDGLGLRVFEGG